MRDDEWPLLRGERVVRFAFGALAGLFAGIELTSRVRAGSIGSVVLVTAVTIAFGIGAAWIGDRFWTSGDR